MVKFYDEETRALNLVTEVKDGELITKEYLPPIFVKGSMVQKAIELGAELEENNYAMPKDLLTKIGVFVTELYGKQFSTKELMDGIDMREVVNIYIAILFGALQGDSKNE